MLLLAYCSEDWLLDLFGVGEGDMAYGFLFHFSPKPIGSAMGKAQEVAVLHDYQERFGLELLLVGLLRA